MTSPAAGAQLRRLVVGLSGASGAILGIRLLQQVASLPGVESHLVLSPAARRTIRLETDWQPEQVEALAAVHYAYADISAPLASGSFPTLGMVIIPCSIKTLSAVANSYADDLLSPRRRCHLERGPSAGAGGARNAAAPRPSTADAAGRRGGRRALPARTGFLRRVRPAWMKWSTIRSGAFWPAWA